MTVAVLQWCFHQLLEQLILPTARSAKSQFLVLLAVCCRSVEVEHQPSGIRGTNMPEVVSVLITIIEVHTSRNSRSANTDVGGSCAGKLLQNVLRLFLLSTQRSVCFAGLQTMLRLWEEGSHLVFLLQWNWQ